VTAFWAAGIEDIFIDGSSCTEKPDPGDVDGYWVEPDNGVHDRIEPLLDRFRDDSGPASSEMEVADVGGSRRGVFHPSRYARKTDGRVAGVFSARQRGPAQRLNSGSQVGIIMIKSDAQRERTAAQIEGFRQALAKVDREMTAKRAAAVRGSYEGMIRQLKDELREYDEIKSGELTLAHVERLDQIAPFVAKMRIAKGVSQTELARRLGVSKQVISRYEEAEYQTVAIARLQEILDAIGIRALVTLSA
jgi:DNA-binding Xre family transcriptional regulator